MKLLKNLHYHAICLAKISTCFGTNNGVTPSQDVYFIELPNQTQPVVINPSNRYYSDIRILRFKGTQRTITMNACMNLWL